MNRLRRFFVPALVIVLFGASVWSWWTSGIVWQLTRTDVNAAEHIQTLKTFFAEFGAWAPLVYLGMVTIEVVVAPLPGLMLYAPGGILFGPFVGGAMALLGNIIGAGIACLLTRSLGGNWLNRFFPEDNLEQVHESVARRGPWLIFLLRLNPLTSSDIISYAAGLTRIPVWKVMLATGLAMTPLCFLQAWLAEGLLTAFPQLIYPLIVCCVGYLVAVLLVVRRMVQRPPGKPR
jgi:uncharacterized membrane protein YdjX (TVP38/TMEM64 family)